MKLSAMILTHSSGLCLDKSSIKTIDPCVSIGRAIDFSCVSFAFQSNVSRNAARFKTFSLQEMQ